MIHKVILVIAFRYVKRLEWDHLGYDLPAKNFSLVQLLNIGLRDPLLFIVRVEDYRPILCAGVGPLPIQFSGIMRDRKEHLEQLTIGDLGRIVSDADRFGMTGCPRAYRVVLSSRG